MSSAALSVLAEREKMGEAEVKIDVEEDPEAEIEVIRGERRDGSPERKIEVRGEADLKIVSGGATSFRRPPPSKHKIFPIQRVPIHVREVAPDAYDPTIISVGPFHHRRLQGNRWLKENFLENLIHRVDPTQQDVASVIERYSEHIKHREKEARGYYSEEWMDLSSKQFLEMLVLDGCFILELFISYGLGESNWTVYANNWMSGLLRKDLMLVENQLPYFILEELFEHTPIPEDFDGAVEDYKKKGLLKRMALYFLAKGDEHEYEEEEYEEMNCAEPYHLLHLLQLFLRPSSRYVSERQWLGRFDPLNDGIIFLIVWVVFFPLKLANLYLFKNKRGSIRNRTSTAKKMMEAWVSFKKDGRQTTLRFTEVKFEGRTLTMPQLEINQLTRTLLPNLIALEQMLSNKKYEPENGTETNAETETKKMEEWFSSFAWLLFNLVGTDDDVAILQREEIILTNIGSDKDVADYITNLCKGHLLRFGDVKRKGEGPGQGGELPYHQETFDQLNAHIDDRSNAWVAILFGTYFSSPWVLIGLWAAIILFVLQVLQVYQAFK